MGALLRFAWIRFRRRLYELVCEAGFEDLQPSNVLMFRYPTIEGLRPSELAEQLGVTKQSANDMLRQLEAKGYVTLETDQTDGRARLIRFTDRGAALMSFLFDAARRISEEWAEAVGADRLEALRATLEELAADPRDPGFPNIDRPGDKPRPVASIRPGIGTHRRMRRRRLRPSSSSRTGWSELIDDPDAVPGSD
ncbi:MAG: MarR family transcriptional regulator [Dehalococcoidia bacterium]|nr:MarR family transcriptional regulator [Dehalococcoidia bacterium]